MVKIADYCIRKVVQRYYYYSANAMGITALLPVIPFARRTVLGYARGYKEVFAMPRKEKGAAPDHTQVLPSLLG